MEKAQVSTSSKDIWGSGGMPSEKVMPFCIVGNHVCIIDFHSGMENIILPSNLYCVSLKRLKTLISKEEIL